MDFDRVYQLYFSDVFAYLRSLSGNRDTAYRVHQFLHQMKEPYKEVFSLRVFGELSFEQIANLFGKSPGWARVTYYRAKQQLIDEMEGS